MPIGREDVRTLPTESKIGTAPAPVNGFSHYYYICLPFRQARTRSLARTLQGRQGPRHTQPGAHAVDPRKGAWGQSSAVRSIAWPAERAQEPWRCVRHAGRAARDRVRATDGTLIGIDLGNEIDHSHACQERGIDRVAPVVGLGDGAQLSRGVCRTRDTGLGEPGPGAARLDDHLKGLPGLEEILSPIGLGVRNGTFQTRSALGFGDQ